MMKKLIKFGFGGGKCLKHFFFHKANRPCMTSHWWSREKAEKLWAFRRFQSRSKQPKNRIDIIFSLKLGSEWLSQTSWFKSSLVAYEYSHIFLTKTMLSVLTFFKLHCTSPLTLDSLAHHSLFLEEQNWHSEFFLLTQGSAHSQNCPYSF